MTDLNLMSLEHVSAEMKLRAEPFLALKTDEHLCFLLILGNHLSIKIILRFF